MEATGDDSFTASGRSGTNLHKYLPVISCPKENHENSARRSFFMTQEMSGKKNTKGLSDSVFY